MTCKKDHSDLDEILQKLDFYQGKDARHKCAGCAYNRGFQLGEQG